MSVKIEQPYPIFRDKIGLPLDGGLIYIGVAGLNPETNPVQCYFDEDFTLLAPQPLRTINGYISRNGSPANIFLKFAECSITIKDRFRITQYTDLHFQLSNFGALKSSQIIDESGLTQQQVNNGVESISDLIAIPNAVDGNRQYVKSYNNGQGEGGGYFVYDSNLISTNNGSTIFNGWVRINFNILTPEMCGAGDESSDNTIPFERFLVACGTGIYGQAKSNKTYKTNRFINTSYSKSVNIDFNNCILRPNWDIPAGFGADGSIRYFHESNAFSENVSIVIKNLNIDLTSFIPSVSTNEGNRRGIRGIILEHPEHIFIENYKCEGAFYGSGLMLLTYRFASLNGVDLPNCGMKINPTTDDTGSFDAAGDAIYLGTINGDGQTNIVNLNAYSQTGYMGRAGIVLEQFSNTTTSHIVNLENANFDGYQRVIHQEDHGIGRVSWNMGMVKRFSNLLYNLGGISNINYLDAKNLDIDVNPPFGYGGTSGMNNFQSLGDATFDRCKIKYNTNVFERGNKFINNCILDIGTSIVDHAVSTKTHRINNTELVTSGGFLYYTSGNKGVSISNSSINGVAGSLTPAVRSSNGLIKINNCKMTDASLFAENTAIIGRDKNAISNTEIVYTGNTPAVLFLNSFQTAYKIDGVNIKSSSSRVELYGEGSVRYSIINSEFVNSGVNVSNLSATSPNDVLKIRNCELYYTDSYGLTSPISNSFNTIYAIISDNLIFDSTTAQNISLPTASATIKLDNNHFVKGGAIT